MKKFIIVIFLLSFLLFKIVTSIVAQTPNIYYIDPSGDNNNSGISQTSPWQDFTNLKNKTLLPGEKVLLKKGGIWNQEMEIIGKGTSGNFIEIGSYGTGNKPKICRNNNTEERVITWTNPSYAKISEIELCNAGAGIVLYYTADNLTGYGNSSVYIDNITAHHLTGIYNGVGNGVSTHDYIGFSGGVVFGGTDNNITRTYTVLNDLRITNSEFYNDGNGVTINWFYRPPNPVWIQEHKFTNVIIDNCNFHDNNTNFSNNSIRIQTCTNCTVRNSIIDKGTGTAPNGTAAIVLGDDRNITIDNVTIKNTPLTSSTDNVAIDFESNASNVTIQNSRFENNAGPAISFLSGLVTANKNVEIKNNTFIGNDYAHKFIPLGHNISAQITVINWPTTKPDGTPRGINDSTGNIHDNYYQNAPNTLFFATKSDPNYFSLSNNNDILTPLPTNTPIPTPTTPQEESRYSFDLHAPYNSKGDLSYPDIISPEFLNLIDRKINFLGNIKIIRNTGRTGLVAKQTGYTLLPNCNPDQGSCYRGTFSATPNIGWNYIDQPIKHIGQLGKEILLETILPDNLIVPNSNPPPSNINVSYVRTMDNINTLKALTLKALKRYDGDCDINDDGDCTDNYEGTQENPTIIYPKVKYWDFPSEPYTGYWMEYDNGVPLLAKTVVEIGTEIKRECPDCKIILPALGYFEQWENFYRDILTYITSTNRNIFDVFDFHHHHQCYYNFRDSNYQKIADRVLEFNNLLNDFGYQNIPIWITELSSWSGSPEPEKNANGGIVCSYPNHTETDQASELVKRYLYPFSLGIKKVFWSPGIIDYPTSGYGGITNHYFGNIGLILKNGINKLSFCTFKLMSNKLNGFNKAERINLGNPDLYLIKFSEFTSAPQKRPSYVLWKENGNTTVDLSNYIPGEIIVTRINNTITQELSNSISIDKDPKFIEEKNFSIPISCSESTNTPTPTTNPCPNGNLGNINCSSDGKINEVDLNLLLVSWTPNGPAPTPILGNRSADLNGDGKVDEIDLNILLRNWNP